MNRLIYNYKAKVLRVVDARTLEVMFDWGMRRYEKVRVQLIEADYWSDDSSARDRLARAKECLQTAIMDGEKGRELILAPTNPNAFNKAYFRAYVPCESGNPAYPMTMFPVIAAFRFLHLNHYMIYLSQKNFDVTEAKRIVESSAPMASFRVPCLV